MQPVERVERQDVVAGGGGVYVRWLYLCALDEWMLNSVEHNRIHVLFLSLADAVG